MSSPTLYVVLADGWYISRKGIDFVASPDKNEAQKFDLKLANNLFKQLRTMGHEAKIEFV